MSTAGRQALEQRLCELFGYEHGALFGRARSGLTCLLEALGSHGRTVIIPSNACTALVFAVLAAGARVQLAQVDPSLGVVADAELAEQVRAGPAQGVAMVVHLYGFVQDYPLTRAAVHEKHWFLLENDSAAAKAPAPHEYFGDALLLSFGSGKNIDAGGGGAVLCRTDALADELAQRCARYQPLDARAQAREEWLALTYRRLLQGPPGGPSAGQLTEGFVATEASAMRLGFPAALVAPLTRALSCLLAELDRRRSVAAEWDRRLSVLEADMRPSDLPQPGPWRVVRRVAGCRDTVVAALRASGFDAGTNYPALTGLFPRNLAGQEDARAQTWGREVLTLWVTPEYPPARIDAAVSVMRRALAQR